MCFRLVAQQRSSMHGNLHHPVLRRRCSKVQSGTAAAKEATNTLLEFRSILLSSASCNKVQHSGRALDEQQHLRQSVCPCIVAILHHESRTCVRMHSMDKISSSGTAGNASLAVTGGLAIAVPLEMRGLHTLHRRHGVLPWAELVMPLVPIARHGFPAHPYLVKSLSSNYTQQVRVLTGYTRKIAALGGQHYSSCANPMLSRDVRPLW